MKTVTMAEMKQHPDRILKIARKETVTITERGKPLLIIQTASEQALERVKEGAITKKAKGRGRAIREAALKRAKDAITRSDDDLNDFGVFDWQ